jgi:hypothetical protein
MRQPNKIRFKIPSSNAPTIEFDQSVGAWYVRFNNSKVSKTVPQNIPGLVAAMDLDSDGEVVGLELIGVREFSISLLKKVAPVDVSRIDFDNARFIHVRHRESESACAI